jgi:phenylacetate-coenzyme A ligase PaaK-like adenylate-forming protein
MNTSAVDPGNAVHTLAAQMLERDRWTPARMRAHQAAGLQELLQHAVAHSPHYRAALGPLPRAPLALRDLPVLTKATLTAQFDRIVTDPRLPLAELERHLAGAHAADPLWGQYRVVGSGGTTGQRGVVVYDRHAWDHALASVLRVLALQEVAPDARVLGIGAPTPLHMTHRLFGELRAGRRDDAPRLAVTTPIPAMVDALNAFQPEVLISYPSVIRRLAEEQQSGRLRIAPHKFSSCAETLTRDVRDLAAQVWNAPVLDVYASTETCVIGAECAFGTGLHVPEDLLIVEVVDAHDRPVPPGVVGDKVLVTVLFNRALPLIRYELSDLAAVATQRCACGRPHLRLASVRGRREDLIHLRSRDGRELRVNAFLLGETLLHVPDIRQYQMSALPDGLRIRVVLREGASAAPALHAARAALTGELDHLGAAVHTLDVLAVEQIERAGTAAKQRALA